MTGPSEERKADSGEGFAVDRAQALRTLFPQRVTEPYQPPPMTTVDLPPAPRRRRLPVLIGAGVAPVVVAVVVGGYLLGRGSVERPEPPTALTVPIVPAAGATGGIGPSPAATSAGRVAATGAVPEVTRSSVAAPTSATARPPAPKGRANADGKNLALGAAVTASSVEGAAWAAGNAVDGDSSTRWSSGFADPQWIRVDLGELWTISRVQVEWEHAHATEYRIDVSADGTKWTTIFRTDSGTGGTVTAEKKAEARYVRMYGTARVGRYGYSIQELRVF